MIDTDQEPRMAPLFTYVPEADRQAIHGLAKQDGFFLSHYLRRLVRQHLEEGSK